MASLSALRAFANGEISSLTEESYISYQRTQDTFYDLTLDETFNAANCMILEEGYHRLLNTYDSYLNEGVIGTIFENIVAFFKKLIEIIKSILNKIKEFFRSIFKDSGSSSSSSSGSNGNKKYELAVRGQSGVSNRSTGGVSNRSTGIKTTVPLHEWNIDLFEAVPEMAYGAANNMLYGTSVDAPLRLESPTKLVGDGKALSKFKEFRQKVEGETGAAEAIINNMMMKQIFNKSGEFTTTQSCTDYMNTAYKSTDTKDVTLTQSMVDGMSEFIKGSSKLSDQLLKVVNCELKFCEEQKQKAEQINKSKDELIVRSESNPRIGSGERGVTKYGQVANTEEDDAREQEKLINAFYKYMMVCVNATIRFLNSLESTYLKNLRICYVEYHSAIRSFSK